MLKPQNDHLEKGENTQQEKRISELFSIRGLKLMHHPVLSLVVHIWI